MLRVQSSAWHRERFSVWMSRCVSGFALTCPAMMWAHGVVMSGKGSKRPWFFHLLGHSLGGLQEGRGRRRSPLDLCSKCNFIPWVNLGAVCASLAPRWRQGRKERGGERPNCFNSQRLKDVCGRRMQLTISKVLILGLVLPSPRAGLSLGLAGEAEVEDACTAQGRTGV